MMILKLLRDTNRYSDDYKMSPFLQSRQTWDWRVQEEQNDTYAVVLENDATSCVNGKAYNAVDWNKDMF